MIPASLSIAISLAVVILLARTAPDINLLIPPKRLRTIPKANRREVVRELLATHRSLRNRSIVSQLVSYILYFAILLGLTWLQLPFLSFVVLFTLLAILADELPKQLLVVPDLVRKLPMV